LRGLSQYISSGCSSTLYSIPHSQLPDRTQQFSIEDRKGMADSVEDKLSIKLPDIKANSTEPSDAEGEKEASPSPPPGPSVPPPPNGGLKAWLQVAGSFLLVLNTW
jgi:hypothetical protein